MVYQIKTEAEFEQFLRENENVVCDIYASWCGPCQMLAPVLTDASNLIKNVTFIKVDSDELFEIANRFDITAVPTVLVFKNGQLTREITGYHTLPDLAKEINAGLAKK